MNEWMNEWMDACDEWIDLGPCMGISIVTEPVKSPNDQQWMNVMNARNESMHECDEWMNEWMNVMNESAML